MVMAPDASIILADGAAMPQFGLGVWQTPADETEAVVRDALDAGYRAVDTAAIYGNEEGVGRALEGRTDVFVTTKLWNNDQGYDAALRAFDESLARLKMETIDLYLIHWPAATRDLYVDSWRALVQLKEEGRARSIGVSNFRPEHIERLVAETGETPVINQIELHPRFQQREARAFHSLHNIATESWSPLGKGQFMEDPALVEIAERYGKTAAQVIIRWHLDCGLVVIPKSVRPERLRENIDVFDFTLSDEDLAVIAGMDAADGRLGPDPLTATF
jgi:2,5-diketo-D-gluconate reductase A